jgi:hypothetical protein
MTIALFNDTPYPSFGFDFEFFDPREYYCLAVKGSFFIDKGRLVPKDADDQVSIAVGDVYVGEPGGSGLRESTDLIPRRNRTDVLVIGHAFAPSSTPSDRWLAELKIGGLYKSAQLTGTRQWNHSALRGWTLSAIAPVLNVDLIYENSFGGEHETPEDDERDVWLQNPVGRGFVGRTKIPTEAPRPAPQILHSKEELSATLDRQYQTVGFGPIPGDWSPRVDRIGTTDQSWIDKVAPHYPKDFDFRFYNCAPDDQQADGFLLGNEHVALSGIFPELTEFYLPSLDVNALMVDHDDILIPLKMDLSSVAIKTEDRSVELVWRLTTPAASWKEASISVMEGWK